MTMMRRIHFSMTRPDPRQAAEALRRPRDLRRAICLLVGLIASQGCLDQLRPTNLRKIRPLPHWKVRVDKVLGVQVLDLVLHSPLILRSRPREAHKSLLEDPPPGGPIPEDWVLGSHLILCRRTQEAHKAVLGYPIPEDPVLDHRILVLGKHQALLLVVST